MQTVQNLQARKMKVTDISDTRINSKKCKEEHLSLRTRSQMSVPVVISSLSLHVCLLTR